MYLLYNQEQNQYHIQESNLESSNWFIIYKGLDFEIQEVINISQIITNEISVSPDKLKIILNQLITKPK